MTIRIEIMNDHHEQTYERFILASELTSIFSSNRYRILLRAFLQEDDFYLLAFNEHNDIIGVLPSFLKKNDQYGNILNSLPFYGSNGAIIEYNGNNDVRLELIKAYERLAQEQGCIASTLITYPGDSDASFYDLNTKYHFKDKRIGQITKLPAENIISSLMEVFHSKTRNMVRKSQKSGISVSKEFSEEFLLYLINTHQININGLGGIAKPPNFFKLISKLFSYEKEFRIYTAIMNDIPVASLLLLYFNKTVEYFTPVISDEYRNLQPMSLLIFEAMKDAIQEGFKWWNWGGTWLTQDGVYHFKKRWGADDRPYYYYTRIFDEKILSLDRPTLLSEYPYFFVVPFANLKS